MASFVLTVEIDRSMLAFQSRDNLCIAKKVGDKYTTIFEAGSMRPRDPMEKTLLARNDFRWSERYRVFATSSRQDHGMTVSAATEQVDISFGSETAFHDSRFSDASPAPAESFTNSSGVNSPQDSFIAKNIPSQLRLAVAMQTEGDQYSTIYVDNESHMGNINQQITPKNEYMVFWDSRLSKGSLFDVGRVSNPYTLSFQPGQTTAGVRYGYATADRQSGPDDEPGFHPFNP